MANYVSQMIDKTDTARRNASADPENKDRRAELEDLNSRKNAAMDASAATGAGRGQVQEGQADRAQYNSLNGVVGKSKK